ncbi:hypothetical protein [Teredinibacter franksiae]|uniref:hypothetical protein n=1 Tax=Teredinibacter franksiae TaxID=2761453 RepID=UPI0016281686|nr:hypothetical protein [Teredinibacter franksiae]
MNNFKMFGLYSTIFSILGLVCAYFLWEHAHLSRMLNEAHNQCTQDITLLSEKTEENNGEIPVTPLPANTTKLTKEISPAPTYAPAYEDAPIPQQFSETLDNIVKRKYRFLLARLQLSDHELTLLIELLEKRENIHLQIGDAEMYPDELDYSSSDIADLRYDLEQTDEKIEQLIGDSETENKYTLLKNSDKEQDEFNQYALGLSGLFPLDKEQQETVLFSRLRHKKKFEEAITKTGFHMDYPLTYAQQQEIIAKVNFAAFKYKESYLNEVKPNLEFDDTPMSQFTLLENYTNTEFEQLQESLRKTIEKRGVMDPYK